MAEQAASKMPQIRFKGFKGEWSEMPMGQLLTFKNGYNASKSQYGRGEKFINVLDIIRNDYITYDKIIGRVSIPLKEFAKNEVIYGDILFQRSSETLEEVGQANVYLDKTRPATFGGFVIRGRPLIDFNPSFFNATLKSPKSRRDITSRSGGSTRYNIGQESLEASLVRIAPDLLEQGKVAGFVMSVDRLIWLHQRKHDKLVTLKKAMLQKMFPQPGATTPEIRFKGFLGEWVENKLGEVMAVGSVKRIHQSDWTKAGVRFLRARDIVSAYKNEDPADILYISQAKYDEYSLLSGKVELGDLLVTGVGTIGISYLIRKSDPVYFKDGNIIWFKNHGALNGDFLYYSFVGERIQNYIKESAGTGTVGTYTISCGKNTPFASPLTEEQQKIGTYFRTLDSLISKHATQLQKLQQIKSACLQRMFV